MKKIKRIALFLLLSSTAFYNCSSSPDDPTEKPSDEGTEQGTGGNDSEEENDVVSLLCDGTRFVSRKMENYNSTDFGGYTAVSSQLEYTFRKDGTGVRTVYSAETTPRGFVRYKEDFTWNMTESDPMSLTISVDGESPTTLSNVEVMENGLFSSEEVWTKEVSLDETLSKEGIVSYSVNMQMQKDIDANYGGMIGLSRIPGKLTVKTLQGNVTFITYTYGYLPYFINMPCSSKDGGPLVYRDAYIYAEVDLKNPYPYSFFELIREDTERSFIEDGKMYFCLGTFDAETKEFSLIEVGKEYEINN